MKKLSLAALALINIDATQIKQAQQAQLGIEDSNLQLKVNQTVATAGGMQQPNPFMMDPAMMQMMMGQQPPIQSEDDEIEEIKNLQTAEDGKREDDEIKETKNLQIADKGRKKKYDAVKEHNKNRRKIGKMNKLVNKMMGAILEQVEPSFCWKDGIKLPSCPSGYNDNGVVCQKNCRRNYRNVAGLCYQDCPKKFNDIGFHCQREGFNWNGPWIQMKKKAIEIPHTITFLSDRTCPNKFYNTKLGQCVPDCNKMYTGLENCGWLACARDKQQCKNGVLDISQQVVVGSAELTSFVLTAGQSGAFTTTAKTMFKKEMKKGLKGLGKKAQRIAAKQAKDFLKNNIERVSEEAVTYLYAHHSQSFFDEIFNTQYFPELKKKSNQQKHLIKFSKGLIKKEFENVDDNMKKGVEQVVDGVADFMLNGHLDDCKVSTSGNGNVNDDIMCAKGIIDAASNFDPTGVLTIASAFLHPICGVKSSKNQNSAAERCSGTKCSGYRGQQTKTVSGRTCQRWGANYPHKNGYTPQRFPNFGLAGNYCRNPSGGASIWCYTTDPKKRWEYCTVKSSTNQNSAAERCSGTKCSGYRGQQTKTVSGRTCQRWGTQYPHKSDNFTPQKFPNSGLAGNYCRNPSGSKSIWCYTTDPKKRWEYCKPL